MTIAANGVVAKRGGFSVRNVVRIVAGGAPQLSFALEEALRFPHPVCPIRQLKPLSHPSRSVERQPEVTQRLSRPVRKRSAVQPANGVRQSSRGGLQMALHADL